MTSICEAARRYLDNVWVFSNEYGQAETQKIIREEPLRGNAVYACGGLFALNLASLNPGITHVCIFDLSDKVALFWANVEKFFDRPSLPYDDAKKNFLCELNLTDFSTEFGLKCEYQLSFFSSRERFERILEIFRRSHFSFTKADLGDPDQVRSFLATRKLQGIEPHMIYTSNIQSAVSGMGDTMEGFEKFRRSMELLPKTAILIDSIKTSNHIFATQRVTLSPERPAVIPNCYVMMAALHSDDYEKVKQCLDAGADLNQCTYKGFTALMAMAAKGNFNSVRALIDSHQVDINAKGPDNLSALHYCVIAADQMGDPDRTGRIIDYLIEHGAVIDSQDIDGTSPLYQATALGQTACVRKLLEKGANPAIPDHFGETAIDLLLRQDTPVFRQQKIEEMQTLLAAHQLKETA